VERNRVAETRDEGRPQAPEKLGLSLLVLYVRCYFHFFADTVKLGMPFLAPLDGEGSER
jgi:hypothetical protein